MFFPRTLVLGCTAAVMMHHQPSNAMEYPNPISSLTKYEKEFRTWMKEFGVMFSDVESFFERFHIFSHNAKFIDEHNENAAQHGYTLKHNAFSNLTWTEFRQSYFGLNVPTDYMAQRQARQKVEPAFLSKYQSFQQNDFVVHDDVPDTVDWVEKGGVSGVKNQGQCGSCWAFSTTGAIEGAAFVSGHQLENLSEQELVDCDHADMGCNGGLMDHAFYWAEKHGGMCREEDYVYHAQAGTCAHASCENVVSIETFHDVPANDEQALKVAVAQQPVAVAIEADQRAFQFYSSGVFTAKCGSRLDHGVLAVGYGTLDGTKYWKVKNSWGPKWGLDGYILLERDIVDSPAGQCGIAACPSYPSASIISKHVLSSSSNLRHVVVVGVPPPVTNKLSTELALVEQCGTTTQGVQFSDFQMTPSTPLRGQPIEVTAKGRTLEAFSSVDFKIVVKLGGEEVYSSQGNMCGSTSIPLPLGLGQINVNGFQCPVIQGLQFDNVKLQVLLPVIAPSGNYEIHISGNDPTGTQVFCMRIQLDLTRESERASYYPNQVYQILGLD